MGDTVRASDAIVSQQCAHRRIVSPGGRLMNMVARFPPPRESCGAPSQGSQVPSWGSVQSMEGEWVLGGVESAWRRRVSLLSRYGTCVLPPALTSLRESIT